MRRCVTLTVLYKVRVSSLTKAVAHRFLALSSSEWLLYCYARLLSHEVLPVPIRAYFFCFKAI